MARESLSIPTPMPPRPCKICVLAMATVPCEVFFSLARQGPWCLGPLPARGFAAFLLPTAPSNGVQGALFPGPGVEGLQVARLPMPFRGVTRPQRRREVPTAAQGGGG